MSPESSGKARNSGFDAAYRPGMTLEDADLRTLPRRAGAGSYGALSRPAENVSQMHAASAGLRSLEGLAKNAPVAQLDRALDYESRGQEFESLRARQYWDCYSLAEPFVH